MLLGAALKQSTGGRATAVSYTHLDVYKRQRISQATAIAKYAEQIGADYLCHGSTGAGNDLSLIHISDQDSPRDERSYRAAQPDSTLRELP